MDKKSILELVQSKVSEKIQNLERLIAETRASNNDTKSSMGDKYETGREMLQQEINNLQIQLNEFLKQQNVLKTLKTDQNIKVEKGALVETEKGIFYISASVGEINFDGNKIIAVSEESPLAMAMKGKSENDVFSINTIAQKIKTIL